MSVYAFNLLRIAREIEKSDPLLGYELDSAVREFMAGDRVSVINPEARSFERDVKEALKRLEGIRDALKKAEDTEDFADAFDKEALADLKALKPLAKTASVHVAGPKDWFKKLFKKKEKPAEDEVSYPSYKMEESDIESWLKGESEWDSAAKIGEEAEENKKFFGGLSMVVESFDNIIKKPTKSAVKSLLEIVEGLISLGKRILGHKDEPAKAEPAKSEPSKPKHVGPKTPNFEGVVDHYADMLKEHSGDVGMVKKYIKELLNTIKSDVDLEEKMSFASRRSAARRLASFVLENPRYKRELIPVIVKLNS